MKPDDIHKSVVEHGKEIEALREDQAELRFSIRLLAENVRSLPAAVEKSR